VLIEQFRCGTFVAGHPPWMIEIVAGIIENGELPEEVARRETLEETGLILTKIEKIAWFLPSPGAMMETVTVYCGQVDSSLAEGYHGVDEEGEDIRLVHLPTSKALQFLIDGRADTAITIVALQWLALNRGRIRESWQNLIK
jgi:ADP-ribose pyrophosphatase